MAASEQNSIRPDAYSLERMEVAREEVERDQDLVIEHPYGRGDIPADLPPRATWSDKQRLAYLAVHAERVFPGPIGQLVRRELAAIATEAFVFGQDSLLMRVADEVEKEQARQAVDAAKKQAGNPYGQYVDFTD